jgi:HD-GYP domain-containing protein (c-di-GMP phosphodiesterase class II)
MFTIVIVLGIQGALLVSIIGLLIAETLLKRPYYKALFNAGQYALTVFVSGWLFFTLKQSPDSISLNIIYDWAALIAFIISYFMVNMTLVSSVISLTARISFFKVFFYDYKMTLLHHATSSTIGLAMVSVYDPLHPFVILLFFPPLFLIDQAFRWYYALHRAASKTIKALADIVDKRDKYTSEHSSRVATYAGRIATQMKLTDEEISNIEIAASVHDLGKIGIEDKIITKSSSLTDEEYALIKKHPEIAYDLIKNLRPYEKSAIFVLHHHEWVNGNGYPKRLQNSEIPMGAKIIGVADAFDAMTTIRPYRGAYTTEEAVSELKRCSGTQFDAKVVEALTEVLKTHNGYKEE